MTSVSVIVPVYNMEDYLERCLDSLVNQTLESLEIICVDDGSKDSSGAILDKYAAEYPSVTVIHSLNCGVSNARNTGLERASGRYVGFVDSDDYVSLDMFEKLYDAAEKNSVDIVQCSNDRKGKRRKSAFFCGEDEIVTAFIDGEITNSVCDKLYSRNVVGDINFPQDLRFAEDFEFNARVLCRANYFFLLPDVLYHYTVREGSETHLEINDSHICGFRVYDFLKEKCPDNRAVRERELSESLRFLDSVIGHENISAGYINGLVRRIKRNRKYLWKNRYIVWVGQKIRCMVAGLFPSLYIFSVKAYKKLRKKNV